MAKKVGLPDFVKSRHDNHFVEEISSRTRTSIIRRIPVERIIPNLMQPRKDFGNIDELANSIGEKGILEPILVRSTEGKFEIIAGERRFRAAKLAGLLEIPCIEFEIPDNEALELSIIENIQRKDLNVYEQAYSLKSLSDIYGYTHEEIAAKLGKSRVTISELLRITDLPPDIIQKAQHLKIESKTFLIELAKVEDKSEMHEILDKYQVKPFSRDEIKERRKTAKLPPQKRNSGEFKFKFTSPDKRVKLNFNIKAEDSESDKKEMLLSVLNSLIEEIRSGKFKDL